MDIIMKLYMNTILNYIQTFVLVYIYAFYLVRCMIFNLDIQIQTLIILDN